MLGVEKVGIHDNFFDLGGDSIITIQAVSRARHKGYEFHVGDIFTSQTVAKLAALIEQKTAGQLQIAGEQDLLTGKSGLLPVQQRYFAKKHVNINHFNQAVLLQIDKSIDETILDQAIQQLLQHHDALRFRFYRMAGEWQQEYGSPAAVLTVNNLSQAGEDQLAGLITELSAGYQRNLNIEQGQLVKACLVKTPVTSTHNRLLIVIHHLVVDGVSWRILLEDLEMLIKGLAAGEKNTLGNKTSSYRQWYNALEQYGRRSSLLSQSGYWQKIVNSYQSLPVDKLFDGPVRSKERGLKVARLGSMQTRKLLQDTPKLYHTEINDVLLSALYITLRKWSGQNKITIGLEGHGRQDISHEIDTSRTVGWFTTHYPLLVETANETPALEDYIKSVKELLRRVPDKGLGYGVLKYINRDEFIQEAEPWDIVFNYLGQLDNILIQGNYLSAAGESAGQTVNEDYQVSEKFTVSGSIQNGELQISWTYSKLHYHDETIIGLVNDFISNLEAIIAHCTDGLDAPVQFTPSDYGLGSIITYNELDQFLAEKVKDKTRRESIESLYRLSGLQQGLLFHSLYETGFGTYVHQFGCDLVGIDLAIFIQSWNLVISNHSILRTAFYHDAFAIPVQTVYSKVALPVEILDLRQLSAEDQKAALNDYKNKDRLESFDYKMAPLMRLAMIQVSEERFRMIWTWHHILFDGWSMPILMEEFLTTYESLVSGKYHSTY